MQDNFEQTSTINNKYNYYPRNFNPVIFLILITFIVRLLFITKSGYVTDINTFKSWSIALSDNGLKNFYYADMFTDYPPLYMYFLYVIGKIATLVDLAFDSTAFTILIKLNAIIFDTITVVLLYKIGCKKLLSKNAFIIALAYSINPAIFVDSAIYGQIDSFYALLIALSIYFVSKDNGTSKSLINKNYIISYLIFTLAVLAKPQSFIFTPLYIFLFIHFFFTKYSKKQKLYTSIASILSCILLFIIVIKPFIMGFDVMTIINQYVGTLSQYDYTTLNAYNFYALIGKNFVDANGILFFNIPYKTFGTFTIVFFTILTFYFLYDNRENKFSYFFACAFLNTSTYMFSIKMHERYLFITLLLLLLTYIYNNDKRLLYLFITFSITLYINCTDVIKLSIYDFNYDVLKDGLRIIPYINIAGFIYMFYIFLNYQTTKYYDVKDIDFDNKFYYEVSGVDTSKNPKIVVTKKDILYLGLIIIVYSIIAFYNLGINNNPDSALHANNGDTLTVDFDKSHNVKYINTLLGVRDNKDIIVKLFDEKSNSFIEKNFTYPSVFKWEKEELDCITDSITIEFKSNDTYFQEISFLDENENVIPLTVTGVTHNLTMEEAKKGFDEQSLVQSESTYLNSTYFDEIYHPRTAYEFVHKLKPYENTHPPLGKDIMALSINAFGMSPFAYRLPGVISGILMLPVIYVFALFIFKKTNFALFTTALLSLDFMHFSQTRLATIDSFSTLFIMAMFLFMYLYYKSNFYTDNNKRLLVYLFFSGLFMGLSVSTKWTGVYAGIGAGIIFFITLFNRYNEYIYEKYTDTVNVTKDFFNKTYKTCLWCVLFFVIIPTIIYFISYIPFANALDMPLIKTVIDNQGDMLSYHSNLVSTHPYASDYYTWLIMLRPVYYYANTFSDTIIAGISGFGNPIIWYSGTIAVIYTFTRLKTENAKTALFLLIAYFSLLLPWAFVPRTMYMYHYFPCTIFMILMISNMMNEIFKTTKNKYVIIYIAIAVILFIMFYPVISGMPVAKYYVKILKFLPTWALGPV